MEIRKYVEKYGIRQNGNRYAIVTSYKDKDENGFGPTMNTHYNLSYVNADFALKKAEKFIKGMHHDFIDFLGRQVIFEFENVGLIPSRHELLKEVR